MWSKPKTRQLNTAYSCNDWTVIVLYCWIHEIQLTSIVSPFFQEPSHNFHDFISALKDFPWFSWIHGEPNRTILIQLFEFSFSELLWFGTMFMCWWTAIWTIWIDLNTWRSQSISDPKTIRSISTEPKKLLSDPVLYKNCRRSKLFSGRWTTVLNHFVASLE